MQRTSTVWGLVLLAIGALLLFGNLGYFGVNWDTIWRLWPAILIYAGLVRILEYLSA